MQPDPRPSDAAGTAARLAVVVCEIRHSEVGERDRLLVDLLRAAWPTRRAQCQ